ncbi:family 20 glycosylhydrolase [Cellulomonas hominis]|uniref:family 20 glycosylhydrolase n=1 Tax=Cellulomonas hominis TaxID=156981 RepID=UPI001B93FE28|nr:family 20 glycosylhydrolase [Cellulomonas hominis]VTR78690.1 Beta-N-acetylhexosaminidase [Cellulomonas hominis]
MPAATTPLRLVPAPRLVREGAGDPFVVQTSTTVTVGVSPAEVSLGVLAAESLSRVSGTTVEVRYRDVAEPHQPGDVALVVDESLAAEQYTLDVSADRVELVAGSAEGLMRAIATLHQVLRPHAGTFAAWPVHVEDEPVHGWRGLSVDVARHFFGPDDLRVVVDLMWSYKLNVLHLHLSDDQGWRIDLPSRPELTARSGGTAVDGDPGGYFTTEEYEALVAYAAARGVRVVPEIDVPGHVNAALHAYGELTESGEAPEAYTGIDVGFSKLRADLPATEPFLRDVFGDVAAVTPGDYVHIGGDEVLTMEHEEYARLVRMAADAVRAAGKKVVGWQEIATTPLEPGTVVQFWDTRMDPAPFVAAARAGARLLMSPGSRAYLDMKYDGDTELGLEWAGHIELRDAYEWEPTALVPGLPEGSVIGVEATVWTETLRSLDDLMTMLLPRLAAVAEVAWTPAELRDWDDFAARVAPHGPYWDAQGLSWYPSPQVDWSVELS